MPTEVDQDFNADRCPARSSTGHRCQASTEPHDWHVHGPLRWTDPRATTEHQMKPARVDFVSACETCPFCSPAYDLGDFCQNTTLPGGGYRPIDGGIDSDPPDWCPLREGPSLVVLANRK